MSAKDNHFTAINIREYLIHGADEEIGEPALARLLSDFSCPKNPDVERFLKNSAIEFTKKNQSVTYLVFSDRGEMLGYFSIAIKPITIKCAAVSKTVQKKLLRVGELDQISQTCTLSAYLIAQLGKNFANECNKEISGVELLKLALDVVKDMQYRGGGVVTFLEANNEAKLLKFYTDNRFAEFNVRQTAANQESPHKLVQLLRLL